MTKKLEDYELMPESEVSDKNKTIYAKWREKWKKANEELFALKAKAKAEGKYKGRTPTVRRLKEQIVQLSSEGMKPSQIASDLGVGVASVYRYRAA